MTVDQWIGVALLGWACGVVTRDVLMAWVEGRRHTPGETTGWLLTDEGNRQPHPSTFAIRYPTADEFFPKRGGAPLSTPPRTHLPKTRCD